MSECNPIREIALAFVGCVVPDHPKYHSKAFDRAGNMFQTNLLTSIKNAGLSASTVMSPVPVPAWPSGGRLFIGGSRYELEDGSVVDSIGFINAPILKQVTIGLAAFRRLLYWGWRSRKCGNLVIYSYNLSVPPGIFTLAAARLIGAKAIAHLCDINIPGETVPNTLLFKLDYKLQRWLMSHFDGLVVVADAIISDFGLLAPHIRVEGGFRESSFSSIPPHIASDEFVIVCAGSLNEANGIKILLEGFNKLAADHFRLRIAGAGPLEAEVKHAAAQNHRIEYCGYLSAADVMRLYGSADLLVNLRLTKSINTRYFFPSKLLEYLASGRPVLSTCTGHVEQEFERFTFLLREESPEALATAIDDIHNLGEDIREKRGAIAREYMMATKTWTAQGRRVVRLIESVATAR